MAGLELLSCCFSSNQKTSLSTPYLVRVELWTAADMPYDMGTAERLIVVHSLEDEPTSKLLHVALVVCILGYKEKPGKKSSFFFFFLQMLPLDFPEPHMMKPSMSLVP